jgi:hypothetical protein
MYFSIALDNIADVSDTSQSLTFIRAIKKDFTVFEVSLNVCYLQSTIKVIFNAVKSGVEEIGGIEKLSSVFTDGTKAMLGITNGFVGL